MTTKMDKVIQHLRSALLLKDGADLTDGQLLECFVSRRETAALEALVRRHGPMVWGVCCRILSNLHDAEDAFQATFLVLVRKAASVRPREMVGNWLHGVARQTALKGRAKVTKQRTRERHVLDMPDPAAKEQELSDEWQPFLDQELSRLPEMYRIAIVLCDLEGKTRKEAARQLGLPEGTLAGRLTRGRAMLAKRLARRGLAVTGGALAAGLSQEAASACLPNPMLSSTIEAVTLIAAGKTAATGAISVKVAALTEGVLKTMLLTKLKVVMVLTLLALPVAGTAIGLLTHRALANQPSERNRENTEPSAARPELERPPALEPRTDESPVIFKNSSGWSWYEVPHTRKVFGSSRVRNDSSEKGYSATIEEDKEGALLIHLTFATSKSATAYRPVVFDWERKRYPLKPYGGGRLNSVKLVHFRLDPKTLPASEVAYLGIEILTAAERKVRANNVIGRAKKTDVEVLPFPEVGAAFDFVLTTMDDKKIRGVLRGKVVPIDAWATSCSPCMAKMPQLKELYEQHRKAGLEIVGRCFDREADKARKTITSKGLDWPQVLVPAEEKMRDL